MVSLVLYSGGDRYFLVILVQRGDSARKCPCNFRDRCALKFYQLYGIN